MAALESTKLTPQQHLAGGLVSMDSEDQSNPNAAKTRPNENRLRPYKYQVHGHHIILKWTPTTVLKNTNIREETFYETLHQHTEILRRWIPQYKGHVHIQCCEEEDSISLKMDTGLDAQSHDIIKLRIQKDSLAIMEHQDLSETHYPNIISSSTPISEIGVLNINPWTVYTLCRRLPSLVLESSQENNWHRFVVLEDLGSQFTHPNILDLKMGTIPLDTTAVNCESESERRIKKEKKWSSTTSAEVGVRIDGMQVFSPEVNGYRCYNKFYGYAMNVDMLETVIEEFLKEFPVEIKLATARNLLENLHRLAAIIKDLDTYRLYSASLIIFIEGDQKNHRYSSRDSTDIPHSNNSTDVFPTEDSHIKATSSYCNHSNGPNHNTLPEHSESSESKAEKRPRLNPTPPPDPLAPNLLPFIDMRLLDFEHTTFSGFLDDELSHKGADTGFLMGIDFMVKVMERYLTLNAT